MEEGVEVSEINSAREITKLGYGCYTFERLRTAGKGRGLHARVASLHVAFNTSSKS